MTEMNDEFASDVQPCSKSKKKYYSKVITAIVVVREKFKLL